MQRSHITTIATMGISSDAYGGHNTKNIKTWYQIYDGVKDLTVKVKTKNAAGVEVEVVKNVFSNVEAVGSTTENPVYLMDSNGKNIVTLNATYCAKYLKDNAGTDEAKLLALYQKYYNEIAYNVFEEEYDVDGTDPSGLCTDLIGEATIEHVDATTGNNFATISGTTITAGLASNVHMTTDEVEVPFKLIIKDKWGMTMEVPFTVVVSE